MKSRSSNIIIIIIITETTKLGILLCRLKKFESHHSLQRDIHIQETNQEKYL